MALLRAHQPEVRSLVRQGLDIITPALPRRLPPGKHKYPAWVKWTKRIIVDEGIHRFALLSGRHMCCRPPRPSAHSHLGTHYSIPLTVFPVPLHVCSAGVCGEVFSDFSGTKPYGGAISLPVVQMANSLNRLGLPTNRPVENRKLAGQRRSPTWLESLTCWSQWIWPS